MTPVDLSAKPVSQAALAPVAGTTHAPPTPSRWSRSTRPSRAAQADTATRHSAPQAVEGDPVGWSRAGGTQVTAKEGETVYNLSRRFGVPADVLMKMNGLSDGKGLQAGQKVIIPTYVYNSKAPVSAPDSDPKVAAAKSSSGDKTAGRQAPRAGVGEGGRAAEVSRS